MAAYSSTKSYPCAKRSCATLDYIRKSRIWEMQIRGREKAYGQHRGGNRKRGVDFRHGRIGRILDQSPQIAGLTKTQYKDWGDEEASDTRRRKRGRSLSERRKSREAHNERYYQEQWEVREDRRLRADEARGRTRKDKEEKNE